MIFSRNPAAVRDVWFSTVLLLTVVIAEPALSSRIHVDDIKTDVEVRAAIDACVEHSMALDGTPGLGLAVIRDHELFYERGYGVRNLNIGGEVDAQTRFRIASVTKIFTAAAIMRLVDDGSVQLDDLVIEFIPELRFEGRWSAETITIRDLLVHTSGIFDSSPPPGVDSLEAMVDWLGESRLSSPPGSFYNYSGPNYSLAGLIVERVTGVSFPDFVQSRLWEAASMEATTFYPDEVIASGNFASGHQLSGGQVIPPQDFHDWAFAPAGHAFSSAHDMAIWAQLMIGGDGEVLEHGSASMMQRPQVWRHDWTGGYYGYGLVVERFPTLDLAFHDGLHVGYVAYLGWVASEGLAIALVANSNSMPIASAANCIFQNAFELPMPEVDEPGDPATWPRYKGTYNTTTIGGLEFPVVIDLVDGELRITYPDPDRQDNVYTATLENLFLDTFRFVDIDGVGFNLTFLDMGGNPKRVGWVRNRTFVGQRTVEPRVARDRLTPAATIGIKAAKACTQ